MKKAFILFNPSRKRSIRFWEKTIDRVATKSGYSLAWGKVNRQMPMPHQTTPLSLLLKESFDRLVIVGGDGTLHTAVRYLADHSLLSKIQIAVLPAGSCNDFARHIGVSKRQKKKAIQLAFNGAAQLADLGLVQDQLFINNAGFGRQPLNGKLPKGTWQTIKSFQALPLQVRWDEGSLYGKFYMMMVCNGPYFSGGLHFGNHADAFDGKLTVTLVPYVPKRRLVWLLLKGKLRGSIYSKELISFHTKKLQVEVAGTVWPQADGEVLPAMSHQVTFSVLPEKVMIVMNESKSN